jgi:hypothetical protein
MTDHHLSDIEQTTVPSDEQAFLAHLDRNAADGATPPAEVADTMDSGPPLSVCPPWCEQPPEHDWEEWDSGLVRTHTRRRAIGDDAIELREFETLTSSGTVRHHEILLDVESSTQWDIPTAEEGLRRLAEALAMVSADSGDRPQTVTVQTAEGTTLRSRT